MQHSWHRGPQAALLRLGWLFFALAFGCGGRSQNPFTDDARDASLCSPPPCATNESWDAASCACESTVGIWPGGPDPDATTACPPGGCPAGSVEAMAGAACTCLLVEAGADEEPLADGTRADAHQDEGQDSPEPSPYDATVDDSAYSSDSPPSYDAYFDSNFCGPMACGPGSAATPDCQCVPCAGSCPAVETQSAGCGTCTACAYKCPASFVYAGSEHGNTCDCEPPGADAGPPFGADAGATCVLEGNYNCSAGSWCPLGICPDNITQYGCFCNPDGTTTCDLTCPTPPPCTIPGLGTCPYGSQCAFGDCAGAAPTAVVCSCNRGGNSSCSTSPCGDGGLGFHADTAEAGKTCQLEDQSPCSAGSWCPLGLCPDGTTRYGCTCNADGTATCDLRCPVPPPWSCGIPGEGMCPYGTTCFFGSCASDGGGTLRACQCHAIGPGWCATVACAEADAGPG